MLLHLNPAHRATCAAVKAAGSTADGAYTLSLSGGVLPVYCAGMSGATPKEYITVSPGTNYGNLAGNIACTTTYDKARSGGEVWGGAAQSSCATNE